MRFLDSHSPLPADVLQLDNQADVLADADTLRRHARVALQFPQWTDGRAYSQAVLLRSRLRHDGELIATGDVVADMLPLLRRCGFDAVQLRADQKLETAQRALGLISVHYQRDHALREPPRAADPLRPAGAAPAPLPGAL